MSQSDQLTPVSASQPLLTFFVSNCPPWTLSDLSVIPIIPVYQFPHVVSVIYYSS